MDLLSALKALKDGDERSEVQPRVAELLGRYLHPRGYRVELNGATYVDITIWSGDSLIAVVEVKRPSAPVNAATLGQLRRYLGETHTATGIATNGRLFFLLQEPEMRKRIDHHCIELLDDAFPPISQTKGANMKNLSEFEFKKMVVQCLDDAGFFSLLRDKIYIETADNEPPEGPKGKPADPLLPSDLHLLEGKQLVPHSKGYAGTVATVRSGRIYLKNLSYGSLSAAARSLTGSEVNGRKWWGLK